MNEQTSAGGAAGDWIGPAEAAKLIGINKRHVYVLINQGELTTDGKAHGQKINRASAEAARLKRIANSAIDSTRADLGSTSTGPASGSTSTGTRPAGAGGLARGSSLAMDREISGQIAQSAIYAIRAERDNLQTQLAEAQAAWRADIARLEELRRLEAVEAARENGRLLERVKMLEAQLAPAPAPAPGRRPWLKFWK